MKYEHVYIDTCESYFCAKNKCNMPILKKLKYRIVSKGIGESWTNGYIFDNKDIQGFENDSLVIALNLYPHYRGAGYSYSNQAYVKRGKFKTIVTQSGGMDI